jgi:hypothetical protein
VTNESRTAGWLLGQEAAFGGSISKRVPVGSASQGLGRRKTFFSPWPASHVSEAAARARPAARGRPAAATTPAAATEAQIEPSSVVPRK